MPLDIRRELVEFRVESSGIEWNDTPIYTSEYHTEEEAYWRALVLSCLWDKLIEWRLAGSISGEVVDHNAKRIG